MAFYRKKLPENGILDYTILILPIKYAVITNAPSFKYRPI